MTWEETKVLRRKVAPRLGGGGPAEACECRAPRSLTCLISQVLGEGPLSSPMGRVPPQCPAMEGAVKHKLLPSLPSLNTTPVAYRALGWLHQAAFPPNGREMQTTRNYILARLAIKYQSFSPRIIFKDGSTGWGSTILLKCGNSSGQKAVKNTEQMGTVEAKGKASSRQHTESCSGWAGPWEGCCCLTVALCQRPGRRTGGHLLSFPRSGFSSIWHSWLWLPRSWLQGEQDKGSLQEEWENGC